MNTKHIRLQGGKNNESCKEFLKQNQTDSTAQKAEERPLEEIWSEEGIEQQAGKGWDMMKAEQISSDFASIKMAVAKMFAPPMVSSWSIDVRNGGECSICT